MRTLNAQLYTTRGSVRGGCGHRHRSIAAAMKCVQADERACAGLAGGKSYSDRCVERVDGADMSEAERAAVWA